MRVLLGYSAKSEEKIRDGKIFASAEEKMKQAGTSYGLKDYSGVMSNLNTALELMLKEKLGIPTTITKIDTANIVEIMIAGKIGPIEHLKEVRKRLFVDAHVKHRGYIPLSNECIHALKAMEDLKKQLERTEIALTEETKDNIYNVV